MTEIRYEGIANKNCPNLERYLVSSKRAVPAMLIFPGGSYEMRAEHEGKPVAKWLNSIGIAAFIVNYRVAPYRHPVPLEDAKWAIRMVRHRAEEWGIDPNRLGAMGFSAGGHLASTLATHIEDGQPDASDPMHQYSTRPDVLVLAYPVITMRAQTHSGSRQNLLGEAPSKQQILELSSELNVSNHTPPTFLWHTENDASVPVDNSFIFAAALQRHQVPHSIHTFERGEHGLGLAQWNQEARIWPKLCENWLKVRNFI
ncbi:esterase/lipase-like protein [Listeria grandensis FSL F6-0971]|uniref:Esterase/lipase-like protein n=1 Tax=Listeria grandensis FSL F6-0971 TaxID=1265819 RepID=W7BL14_9LIST|nr:alpha/beta hydrolase [Listeria grandensis]EUJ20623.1 esterase/lipase-like protein [Listeria grandensis FSL F6-0971]